MAAVNNPTGSRIRWMGCHEAYQLAMHTLDQYRGTIVACCYYPLQYLTRPDSLTVLKAKVCDAIARVVLSQPHLQTGITGENTKNPAFVRLDHLDLRNHIQWVAINDSSNFQQLCLETIQGQLDSRYEKISTQPGWKVVVLQQIGAESIEVLFFHQCLLRYLNDITGKDEEPMVDISDVSGGWILALPDSSHRLPPNPEILTSWPMSPKFMLSNLWKEVKPQTILPPGGLHARWASIQASPFETEFRNFTVKNDVVTKIVNACCLHHTTLTGLVQALCLVSLSTALPTAGGFASRTPYDLRHILPSNTKQYPWLQPKESMCNYVSVVDHEFESKLVETIRSYTPPLFSDSKLPADIMTIVWSVSARVRRELKARLDSGTRNDLIGIMKLCPAWNSQQQGDMSRMRHLSWLVTNLGVLDGETTDIVKTEEAWSLRRAELILSPETPSAALSISIMTVKGREMCVTCSWQDCVVEAELGNRVMDNLEQWLKDIGS